MYLISNKEFNLLSQFIQNGYGIKMPQSKKTMLQSRLQKRLRSLNFDSFKTYCDYVFNSGNGSEEIIHMINAVTTNKTDFFREAHHFRFINEIALPQLLQSLHGPPRKIVAWSAGCSTGEEPYTLAMVMDKYLSQCSHCPFSIVATDISTRVLEAAKLAVYSEESAVSISHDYKKQYLLRSKDKSQKKIRIAPNLRNKIVFRKLNFMDDRYDAITSKMDFIFCRNVLIYFERHIQTEIIRKLIAHLRTGGYLFLGHSETITGMDLPLKQVSLTVYQKYR